MVFVASPPCGAGTRPLPGIPKEAEYELMKWKLQLLESPREQLLGTYILDCDYGLPQQGTKGLRQGKAPASGRKMEYYKRYENQFGCHPLPPGSRPTSNLGFFSVVK
jgi:hypothetical protein